MNIGILTGGGDCPGLNPAIRGVVRRSIESYDYNILGIKNVPIFIIIPGTLNNTTFFSRNFEM